MPFVYNPFTDNLDNTGIDNSLVSSVSGTANRITVTGTTNVVVDIASDYVGQTSLTTLGTITTGTWNGTAIGSTFGGTGQSSYTAGDILYASASNTLSKLPIGSNGNVLSISAGLPSWQAAGSGLTITGNSGGAIAPSASNWNLVTSNSTANVVGSAGGNLTLNFGISNLVLGSSLPSLAGGTSNTGVGNNTLLGVTSASYNTCLGESSCASLSSGQNNVAIGVGALSSATATGNNTGVGYGCLGAISTSTGFNIALGTNSLASVTTGIYNIGIGYTAGSSYTSTESSNIIIGSNSGVVGESNVIRIGTQGSSNGQQTDCYLAGRLTTTSGRVVNVTTPGAYPYTTLTTDYLILVDTSTTANTITPLASPVTGTTYRIKDKSGNAATRNITITPSGNNIDGSASYVININYGAVDIIYNGTEWSVL